MRISEASREPSPMGVSKQAMANGFRYWRAQDAFVAVLPALFIAAMIMFAAAMVVDGDPFMHITAGQWMIQHGAVPHSDPFSYTFLGKPWNAHEWLSEIVMAEAYRLGGMSGLRVLYGLAVAATAFLLAVTLLRSLPPIPALVALMLPLAYLAREAQFRPHILTLPILIFWVMELLSARDERRAPSWVL